MDGRMNEDLEYAEVEVRTLRETDLDRLVRMDARITGRERPAMIRGRLQRALQNTGINVSLGVEHDDVLVGALMAEVHYGAYGIAEPLAVLDTILVDPTFEGRGIGRAMVGQLLKNLRALGVENLRTEVGWNEQELIGFLAKVGFRPAPRLVLDVGIDEAETHLGEHR